MAELHDDFKCGICLELFQDPRNLPCLHTFCRECIQRSLNEENHSLKCPVCRAKHELSEGAELLPVNPYAQRELPLKRLQQQREDNGGPHQLVECKSCGEQAGPVVAWCEECDAMICQQCVALHKKIAGLRRHHIEQISSNSSAKQNDSDSMFSKCLRHGNERLKFVCTGCSELVCSDCLLLGPHVQHKYCLIEEAYDDLKTKMQDLADVVVEKKHEFSEYLGKAVKAEHEELEHIELAKTKVNTMFDGIAASVEAQRNEALQSVPQAVKEIWSQKEIMEVSLAQLDSFTRFAENTHKCMTASKYAAMATQAIKLMKRLKNTHGDETSLKQTIHIGSCFVRDNSQLPRLFSVGQPSLKFTPSPDSKIQRVREGMTLGVGKCKATIKVSLVAGELPVLFPPILIEDCSLTVNATYGQDTLTYSYYGDSNNIRISQADQSSWNINVTVSSSIYSEKTLTIICKVSGAVTITTKVTYTI